MNYNCTFKSTSYSMYEGYIKKGRKGKVFWNNQKITLRNAL